MRAYIWGSLLPLLLVTSARADAPASAETAWLVVGQRQAYRPALTLEPRGMQLSLPALVATRIEGASAVPVDAQGSSLEIGAATNVVARVGLAFNSSRALIPFNFAVDYEHDVITGPVSGGPEIPGDHLPGGGSVEHQLRKASGRASLGYYLHLTGGLMLSHWGLGLLANDGAHGWEPGSALFTDPRGGDRTARIALASGPVTPLRIFAAFGHDWVQGDETMRGGDRSRQLIGALTIGRDMPTSFGFYAVRRYLEAKGGDTLDVWALDMYGKTSHDLGRRLRLVVEAETALIIGETTLTSTADQPIQGVLQLGAALRAALHAGRWGAVLDGLYTSGDANFDDAEQNAFKADPNYQLGLLLHRRVLAGMTGRAVATASDPMLSGYPTPGIERFPTRGGISGSLVIFPRAYLRPLAGLEVYGGPLFAVATAPPADPLNTKLAGGDVRNALDGAPGRYLGTELDLGARLRLLLAGTELTVGLEAGVLFPGAALARADGEPLDPVAGGRALVGYRF